jgi:hypothetical protein
MILTDVDRSRPAQPCVSNGPKYANTGRLRCTEVHPEAPESTDSGGIPQSLELKPDRILANEAREILKAIRDGKPVSSERARQFARGWIEMQPLGALALGALDGGLFAGARLAELAEKLLADSGIDRTAIRSKN